MNGNWQGMMPIQGYDVNMANPFVCAPLIPQTPPEVIEFNFSQNVKPLTQERSRELLLKYIADTCCYGSEPAKECTIKTCTGLASMVCEVETFVEYRSTERAVKGHPKGQPFSSPQSGMAPTPWQIPCAQVPHFQDRVEKIEVPFTSSVAKDDECGGDGQVKCGTCGGDGKCKCSHCGGDGKVTRHHEGKSHQESCSYCGGDGKVRCNSCGGDGRVKCSRCEGYGQVRFFIEMTRTHKTLKNMKNIDNIPDKDLSPYEIQQAKGKPILERTAVNMAPPQGFSLEVDQALREIDILAAQQRDGLHAFQHQERIRLSMVPVTHVTAVYEKDDFEWFIYGERLIVKPINYPATMCCGLCEIA